MNARAIRSALFGFLGVALALASGSVLATVIITFNGTVTEGPAAAFATVYREAGFTLTPEPSTMFFLDSDARANPFPGLVDFDDDVLSFNDLTEAQFTLIKVRGGTFNLLSVMTGSPGEDAFQDGFFTFTGNLAGGGTVSTTIAGATPPQTFAFSGFTNLTSVVVTSTDGEFPVMDNIRLVAVPEPGTLALLGLGLLGLGVVRRGAAWRMSLMASRAGPLPNASAAASHCVDLGSRRISLHKKRRNPILE